MVDRYIRAYFPGEEPVKVYADDFTVVPGLRVQFEESCTLMPNGDIVRADQRTIATIPLTWWEMTKDCTRVPLTNEIGQNIYIITREFGQMREKAGSPLMITSGYRPPAVNRAVGGASDSQHIQGLAIDFKPAPGGITLNQLCDCLFELRCNGYC